MERLTLTELVLEGTGRLIPSTVIIGTSGFCKKDLPVIDLVPPLGLMERRTFVTLWYGGGVPLLVRA
jgi:hypothetical protein